jgi:hypothetical protein
MPISNESRGVSLTLYSEDITVIIFILYFSSQVLIIPSLGILEGCCRSVLKSRLPGFLLGLAQAPSGNIRS